MCSDHRINKMSVTSVTSGEVRRRRRCRVHESSDRPHYISAGTLDSKPQKMLHHTAGRGNNEEHEQAEVQEHPPEIKEEDVAETDQPGPDVIVTEAESSCILQMSTDEIVSLFQSKLKLNSDIDVKDGAILDCYVDASVWGQQQKFVPQQLSEFLVIFHDVMQNISKKQVTLVSLIEELHNKVISIAKDCSDTDKSSKPFSTEQGKEIFNYFSLSFFQHFKLYQCLFSKTQPEEMITGELSLEVPLSANLPFPPPLDEGMIEEIITEYLNFSSASTTEVTDEEFTISASESVELPQDLEDIFAKLSPEDVKTIINQIASTVLNDLQANVENKIKSQQATMVGKINKVQTMLPSS